MPTYKMRPRGAFDIQNSGENILLKHSRIFGDVTLFVGIVFGIIKGDAILPVLFALVPVMGFGCAIVRLASGHGTSNN